MGPREALEVLWGRLHRIGQMDLAREKADRIAWELGLCSKPPETYRCSACGWTSPEVACGKICRFCEAHVVLVHLVARSEKEVTDEGV